MPRGPGNDYNGGQILGMVVVVVVVVHFRARADIRDGSRPRRGRAWTVVGARGERIVLQYVD